MGDTKAAYRAPWDGVRPLFARALARTARGVSDRLDRWIESIANDVPPAAREPTADVALPALLPPFEGIRSQPWWDPIDALGAELVAALEGNAGEIHAELLRGRELERSRTGDSVDGAMYRGWSLLPFAFLGRSLIHKHVPGQTYPFPVTASVLESSGRWAGGLATSDTYFSMLAPGAYVAPHTSIDPLRVRMHLALSVPEGDCAMRVGSRTRRWTQGKVSCLDDAFEHEVWNRTGVERAILLADFWNPDLTVAERTAIRDALRSGELLMPFMRTRGVLDGETVSLVRGASYVDDAT